MHGLTDWLYQHSLIGLAVGVVTIAVIVLLYRLTRSAGTGKSRTAVVTILGVMSAGGGAGFFLIKDLFGSAVCGVIGAASVLVLIDLLISERITKY